MSYILKNAAFTSAIAWCCAAFIYIYYFADAPFFWDTIQLASKHANVYYDTGLRLDFLPTEFDSGHIPAFGYYLACVWKVFGRSLVVSHFAMLPFICIYIICATALLVDVVGNKYLAIASATLFLEPTWLAQCSLVSPDIVLLSMLSVSLLSISKCWRWVLALAIVILCLLSIRGIFVSVCLGIYLLWRSGWKWRSALSFLPGATLVCIYALLHYLDQRWVGVHQGSPWKESISLTHIGQTGKNAIIMLWRLVDFGRVVWLGLLGYILIGSKGKLAFYSEWSKVFIILLIGFAMLTLPFEGLTAHRYYMPVVFLGMLVGLAFLMTQNFSFGKNSIVFAIIVIAQLASHSLIYPRHIAQGWDSSLAYVPFNSRLIERAEAYIDTVGIGCDQIGTAFPLKGNRKYRTLAEEPVCTYQAYDLTTQNYILYSNVMNDFRTEDYLLLIADWRVVQRWQEGRLELVLFGKIEK